MPEKDPVDQALDLLVYAPLGLLLTAREQLPALADKGRERITNQVMLARMMGKFAVAEGQKQARRYGEQALESMENLANGVLAGRAPDRPDGRSAGGPRAGAAPAQGTNGKAAAAAPSAPATKAASPAAKAAGTRPSAGTGPSEAAPARSSAHLAIPGYDTLSASQVVQRLAGLTADELEAVREYEAAMRGRRTVLAKIDQLQADRPD